MNLKGSRQVKMPKNFVINKSLVKRCRSRSSENDRWPRRQRLKRSMSERRRRDRILDYDIVEKSD
jgi:hypothetical protein